MNKRILYAPTWRNDIQKAYSIVRTICNKEFISHIEKLGYELWASIHPLNSKLKEMFGSDVLDLMKIVDDEDDVNLVLAHSEILITDYSSIALDFALLKRKIIFYTPDAQEYLASRGVYEEFESLILDEGVSGAEAIISQLSEKKRYVSSIHGELFFRHHDSGARERIVNLTKEKVLAL